MTDFMSRTKKNKKIEIFPKDWKYCTEKASVWTRVL